MKCSSELLTLALLVSGCGEPAAMSVGEPSAGRRADPDRGGVAIVDAAVAESGGKGGSVVDKPARDAGAAGKAGMDVDPGAADRGPYYQAEHWKGYFWTAKNGDATTLTAAKNFSDDNFDSELCVKGSVARTSDSSANAMLGVNINQAKRSDAEPLTVVPSRAGVTVEVKNAGSSPLRVQVAAPDGTTNAQARWCAAVPGSGGFIPWSDFNTACWDGSGKPYAHEPISVAMLLVPGNSEAAQAFDFCLLRLAEAEAPPPGTGAGAAMDDADGGT